MLSFASRVGTSTRECWCFSSSARGASGDRLRRGDAREPRARRSPGSRSARACRAGPSAWSCGQQGVHPCRAGGGRVVGHPWRGATRRSAAGAWTTQAARNFLMNIGREFRFVVHDGAGQHASSFDAVFEATGATTNTATPPDAARSPPHTTDKKRLPSLLHRARETRERSPRPDTATDVTNAPTSSRHLQGSIMVSLSLCRSGPWSSIPPARNGRPGSAKATARAPGGDPDPARPGTSARTAARRHRQGQPSQQHEGTPPGFDGAERSEGPVRVRPRTSRHSARRWRQERRLEALVREEHPDR